MAVRGRAAAIIHRGDGTSAETEPILRTSASSLSQRCPSFSGDLLSSLSFGQAVAVEDGCATPSFAPARRVFDTGDLLQVTTIGEFNSDGKPDLVVVGTRTRNAAVLLGNGDGTFQPTANYDAGSSPWSVVLEDFNRDGKLDLAVGNLGFDGIVLVRLGNSHGTFQNSMRTSIGSTLSFAASDLRPTNHDSVGVLPRSRSVPAAIISTAGRLRRASISDVSLPAHDHESWLAVLASARTAVAKGQLVSAFI